MRPACAAKTRYRRRPSASVARATCSTETRRTISFPNWKSYRHQSLSTAETLSKLGHGSATRRPCWTGGGRGVLRLHHRQGLREHYICQLEARLSRVASQGAASDIIPVVAVIYGSVIADWLALLDWACTLRPIDKLSEGDLQELRERIAAVRTFGAPFSLGTDEQIDNPWDSKLTGKPRDELGETISRLVGQGVASPFDDFSMQATRHERGNARHKIFEEKRFSRECASRCLALPDIIVLIEQSHKLASMAVLLSRHHATFPKTRTASNSCSFEIKREATPPRD